jgi:hypothetical protein
MAGQVSLGLPKSSQCRKKIGFNGFRMNSLFSTFEKAWAQITDRSRWSLFTAAFAFPGMTAHTGTLHRDVLGARKGWMKSVPCAREMSYKEAFDFAIRDFERNHEEYLRFFIQN